MTDKRKLQKVLRKYLSEVCGRWLGMVQLIKVPFKVLLQKIKRPIVFCEEIMKVGRWQKATLSRGANVGPGSFPSRHQRCVCPTERSHQRWPHGGRCAGAQRGARSIYKDERFQPLVVSSGQRDGEPAGSGPKVSQIFQLLNLKNLRRKVRKK